MESILDMLQILPPKFSFKWVLKEIRQTLEDELDFVHEGKNSERCAAELKHLDYLHVPPRAVGRDQQAGPHDRVHWRVQGERPGGDQKFRYGEARQSMARCWMEGCLPNILSDNKFLPTTQTLIA